MTPNPLYLLSSINHPDDEMRIRSISQIVQYISSVDVHGPSKILRKLISKIESMDCPGARMVMAHYHTAIELNVDSHIKEYVLNSRIKMKELYEATAFCRTIMPYFPNQPIIADCCAGNGLTGIIYAMESTAQKVMMIDKVVNPHFAGLYEILSVPIQNKVEYIATDIRHSIPPSSAVVSVHACGDLTDLILQHALDVKIPFAVMPCCHSSTPHLENEKLSYFENRVDAIDLTRVLHAQNNSFEITVQNINPKITKKNRILIGRPSVKI